MGLDLKGKVAQDWGRGKKETGRDVGCGTEVGRKLGQGQLIALEDRLGGRMTEGKQPLGEELKKD